MTAIDALVGQNLAIVRFYANMVGFHFGDIRPHSRGGTVGSWALHVNCPWRIDTSSGTVTGNYDRWDYQNPDNVPEHWTPESGNSLRDRKLSELFGPPDESQSWSGMKGKFTVVSVISSEFGDVTIQMSEGLSIKIFPAASCAEAWRFFSPGDDLPHLIYPANIGEP